MIATSWGLLKGFMSIHSLYKYNLLISCSGISKGKTHLMVIQWGSSQGSCKKVDYQIHAASCRQWGQTVEPFLKLSVE